MLEDILFGQLSMPGEAIRTVLAFLIVIVAAYFDIFNKKNIPDQVLYASLVLAFLVNLFFYQESLFWFSIALAVFFSAIGYMFYRIGQLGGADVFILASVMLLLPIHPSYVGMTFNIPYIFSVIIFSGVAFALYVLGFYSFKLIETEAKPNLLYGLMLIPYLLFAYIYINSFLFSPVYFAFISILLFASIFFMMFRESLNMLLAEELPIAQLEPEDVLALEIMNKDMIERYKIQRMATKSEIERLRKTKVSEVWVYTRLPPFIPFILIGMVLSLLFAKSLLLI
jgi:Flp pilus assembly protein protease CpaA